VKDNMEEKDFIKDLFHDKLSNLETPVRPELWSSVSSSIGASSGSTGLSIITKWLIGTSLTAAVSAGIWVTVSNSKHDSLPEKEPIKVDKQSTIEKKINDQNKDLSQSKLSNVQIKTEVDDYFVFSPEPDHIFESEEIQQNINPTNSISEFKGQIAEEKQDFQPVIQQKTNSKLDSKIENTSTNPYSEPKQTPIESEVKINLPNVFTPNGDGNNDFLTIPKVDLTDFSLVILDERGSTIFTTTDINFGWDGSMMNGEKAAAGNYVYFITAKDNNGKSFSKYSNLSIRY
jgi:gliding motility-associated-like protein